MSPFIVLHLEQNEVLIVYIDAICAISSTTYDFRDSDDSKVQKCAVINVGSMCYTVKETVGEILQKIKKEEKK